MRRLKSYAMFESNFAMINKMESRLRELTRMVFELSIDHIDAGGYLGYEMSLSSPREGELYHEGTESISIAKGMIDGKNQDIDFECESAQWVEAVLEEGMKPTAWFYLMTEDQDNPTHSHQHTGLRFDEEKTLELRDRALEELTREWKDIKIWIG